MWVFVVPQLLSALVLAHGGYDLWRIVRAGAYRPDSVPAALRRAGRVLESVVAAALLTVSGVLLVVSLLIVVLGDSGTLHAAFTSVIPTTFLVTPALAGLLLVRLAGTGMYRWTRFVLAAR